MDRFGLVFIPGEQTVHVYSVVCLDSRTTQKRSFPTLVLVLKPGKKSQHVRFRCAYTYSTYQFQQHPRKKLCHKAYPNSVGCGLPVVVPTDCFNYNGILGMLLVIAVLLAATKTNICYYFCTIYWKYHAVNEPTYKIK